MFRKGDGIPCVLVAVKPATPELSWLYENQHELCSIKISVISNLSATLFRLITSRSMLRIRYATAPLKAFGGIIFLDYIPV